MPMSNEFPIRQAQKTVAGMGIYLYLYKKRGATMINSSEQYSDLNKRLTNIHTFSDCNKELDRSIYENVENMCKRYVLGNRDLESWVGPDIIECIKRRNQEIYQCPMILVLYFLLDKHKRELLHVWEYTTDLLQPIADDLGIAL